MVKLRSGLSAVIAGRVASAVKTRGVLPPVSETRRHRIVNWVTEAASASRAASSKALVASQRMKSRFSGAPVAGGKVIVTVSRCDRGSIDAAAKEIPRSLRTVEACKATKTAVSDGSAAADGTGVDGPAAGTAARDGTTTVGTATCRELPPNPITVERCASTSATHTTRIASAPRHECKLLQQFFQGSSATEMGWGELCLGLVPAVCGLTRSGVVRSRAFKSSRRASLI